MQSSPSADEAALFLDFDGTLIEIQEAPDLVTVPPELLDTLRGLRARLDGALAVVTGRPLEQIDHLTAPERFTVAGTHGAEIRWPNGEVQRATVDGEELAKRAQILRGFAAQHPGIMIEDKGSSLAVHYRQREDLADAVRDVVGRVAEDLGEDFHVLNGKMVAELRPRGVDKGSAVRQLMDSAPFKGRRPVYIGDDVTDEDAFAAVNAMGGHSIVVGDHDSRATARLPDVDAVHAWLRSLDAAP